MTNLILTSNYNGNKLFGVGGATLQSEKILISTESGTSATLLRGADKVNLSKFVNQRNVISGIAKLNDVYVLENGDKKLTIKIEESTVHHETNIYIDSNKIIDATSSKRKTTLTAGVIILLLLIASVVFGIRQKQKNEFNSKSEVRLQTAIENFELKTRDSFSKAQEIAFDLKEQGYKNEKLDDLINKIKESESDILGEVKVDPKELIDLTLQINGFNGNKISLSGKTMFIFDESEKNIVKLGLDGKSASIAAKGQQLDGVVDIGSYDNKLFSLNNDGIYEVGDKKIKLKDSDWGNSIFQLYSANIYMLDKDKNQIYRFSGNGKTVSGAGTSFSDKTDWLAPGVEADFLKVVDMSIDGSIWLLSSTGKVSKFTNGNPIPVMLNGISEKLEKPTAIYTNENQKYVYILDRDKGRVVVLEKNGNYKIQYISDDIKNATDLVSDEENKKIILLTGSKLVYFEPK